MKKTIWGLMVMASLLFLWSCKTSYNNIETTSLQGLWLGTYAVDGNPITGQYGNLIIKPDGTLIYDSDGGGTQHLTLGKWVLSGDVLTCNCTTVYGLESNIGTEQIFTFRYNKKNGALSEGVWKDVYGSGSGTFSLKRVR
ncbi:MAG: hypothetical protein V4556_00410 [Bacteroidota bacterium]